MDHTDQFMLDEDEDYQHHVELKGAAAGAPELETDAARLAQRQKQIDLGKNTQAYRNYLKAVPKHARRLKGKDCHPSTPDITLKASKRCWAGMVRKWRRSLHAYDATDGGEQAVEDEAPLPLAQGQAAPQRAAAHAPRQQRQQQQQQQQGGRQRSQGQQHAQHQRPAQQAAQQHVRAHAQARGGSGMPPNPPRQALQQPHQHPQFDQRRGAARTPGAWGARDAADDARSGRGDSGSQGATQQRGGESAAGVQQLEGQQGAHRLTPSKREHGSSGGGGAPQAQEAWGTGAKRSRPSGEHEAHTASRGGSSGDGSGGLARGAAAYTAAVPAAAQGRAPRKSWADQVEAAFGDWAD